MIPRLVGKKEMYSVKWIDWHFWGSTIGVVIYIASMWIAGVMQGLMWRAVNNDGTLTYTFLESIIATKPYYAMRLLGGLMFFAGMCLMAFNVYKTLHHAPKVQAIIPQPKLTAAHA